MNANWRTCLFQNPAAHTQKDTWTAEATIIAGNNQQPVIPANFLSWHGNRGARLTIQARGIVGSTGTPTYIFQWRANTTSGVTNLAGDSIGVTAAITTSSGAATQWWEANLTMLLLTPAQTDAAIFQCSGSIRSPGGFAAPYEYSFAPTTPPTATWTATLACDVAHYINLSATCSASSASNLLLVQDLVMWSDT